VDTEGLVQEITAEVLRRLDPAFIRPEDRRALVVLGTEDPCIPRAIALIGEALGEAGRPDIIATGAVRSFCAGLGIDLGERARKLHGPEDVPRLLLMLREYTLVVLPALSFHEARDIASLRDEEPLARLVVQALLRGVGVVACTDALLPDRPGRQAAPALAAAAEDNLKKLLAFNVSLARVEELGAALAGKRAEAALELVTERDILDLKGANVTGLRVSGRTIVTPLAQDKAKELGIAIVRE
jgi:hypothetical protein